MSDSGQIGEGKTVLVTGATGGLGVHLVRVLHDRGWRIRGLDCVTLQATRREALADDLDVEWIVADGQEIDLESCMQGCHAVVHAAAAASLSAPKSTLYRVNHKFSEQLFRQAAAAGVEQFALISCASVYRSDARVLTEESATEPYNDYEQSKLDAEDGLRRLRQEVHDAPALTVLRPGLLYGPGCTTMGAGLIPLPAILRGISRYLPGLAGGPRTNWCHVEDAAHAVATVLSHDEGRDRLFNVADETALSFGEVLTAVIDAYGIDLGPSVRVPSVALWTLVGPLLDAQWSLHGLREILGVMWRRVQRAHQLESPLKPRLNRDALLYLRDDAIVVADKLRQLGWEPRWRDFRQGIAPTVRWYQDRGWAPRFDLDAMTERRDAKPPVLGPRQVANFQGIFTTDRGDHPLELDLEIAWLSLPIPPGRREGHLQGHLVIDELEVETAVQGTVQIQWLPIPRLVYQFGYRDEQGKTRRFLGHRQLSLAEPLESLLRLEGSVVNERGEEVALVEARSVDGVVPLLVASASSRQ